MKPTTCPFLGLKDDPETHLAFPSLRNCCRRVHPVEPVSLEHQSTHCLGMNYTHCPVLSYDVTKPSPDVHILSPSLKKRYIIGILITTGLFVIFLVIIVWQGGILAQSKIPVLKESESAIMVDGESTLISPPTIMVAIPNLISESNNTPTIIPTLIPTIIPTLGSTQIPTLLPTEAQSLNVTPTPEQIPTVIGIDTDTPFPIPTESICSPPTGWVIYIVQPNDSLFSIGLDFNVTVAELQAANCMGTSVIIYTGQILYVPNVPTRTPPAVSTEAPTATPLAHSATNTPLPVNTQTPTETPLPVNTETPTETFQPTNTSIPTPSKTYTPPPIPTDTLTPPPTEKHEP
jgi:LysM repeat protein